MGGYHILVATDLSDASTRAFAPVARLARALEARVTLFHAILDPAGDGPTASEPEIADVDEYLRRAGTRLRELRARLPDDLQVVVQTATGENIEQIVADFAERNDVDLIAMATRGRSGLRRALAGSVAEAVLRRAGRPVLLFPPPPA